MSGWSCPHNRDGPHNRDSMCDTVAGRACDPGMKGCVLAGRFRFADDPAKNAIPAPRRRDRRDAADGA